MKIFPKQRGQSVIEFSLILPIFALLLFAMIYIGFFLLDYQTLNAAAGVAARDAATQDDGYPNDNLVDKIQNHTVLFLDWYEIDRDAPGGKYNGSPKVTENTSELVTVMIQAKLTNEANENFFLSFLPEAYTVEKSAYK